MKVLIVDDEAVVRETLVAVAKTVDTEQVDTATTLGLTPGRICYYRQNYPELKRSFNFQSSIFNFLSPPDLTRQPL